MRKPIYKVLPFAKSNLRSVDKFQGEPLVDKIRRIKNDNEPIKDGAPVIYTNPKDGVLPAYNIRTDRWEVAADAMDKISAQKLAERSGKVVDFNTGKEVDGGGDGSAPGGTEQVGD